MSSLDDVSRETLAKLECFRDLLVDENKRQNLVSASTIGDVWDRHIADSAQLARLGPPGASWVDIGSGAGLPGIVLACLVEGPVCLIEPRRLRAEFLRRTIAELALPNATVVCAKAERAAGKFDVITARAVAKLDQLIAIAAHLSHRGTWWVLPKGKNAKSELAEARSNWHCAVREVVSETDPAATILVLTQVKAKRSR